MLKKLLFAAPFPKILFTGEKTKTFRVTGGERYNPGDRISLCLVDGMEFAQAKVISKTRKRFRELTDLDWRGHERFSSEEEIYKTYSNWEGFKVTPETFLEIICYSDFTLTNPELLKSRKLY
jgi:hypothetical protein